MRYVRVLAAMFFVVVVLAACADAPTVPQNEPGAGNAGPSSNYVLDPVIVIGEPQCDPWLDLNWCKGGGTCMTSTPGQPANPELITVSSCLGPGDGGGGPGGPGDSGGGGGPGQGDPTPPVADGEQGPGAFVACVGTLLGVLGSTAMMEPLGHNVYNAREEYASAKRMYDAVMANSPTLEIELLYEHRVEVAQSSYRDAIRDYALGAGATVLAVGVAVGACSPGLILPTP